MYISFDGSFRRFPVSPPVYVLGLRFISAVFTELQTSCLAVVHDACRSISVYVFGRYPVIPYIRLTVLPENQSGAAAFHCRTCRTVVILVGHN